MDLPPLEASSLHICYYALENMTEHNMGLPQIFRHVMVPTKLLSDVTRGIIHRTKGKTIFITAVA